jgi:hypothetical protein
VIPFDEIAAGRKTNAELLKVVVEVIKEIMK